MSAAVRLGPAVVATAEQAARAARAVVGAEDRLAFAAGWSTRLPRPGLGATVDRWAVLASVGAVDLTLARTLEPHADALAILAEAELPADAVAPAGSTWGVYAAEGPGVRLTAYEGPHGWRLEGVKPWCSLAGQVSHALVTAWVTPEARGLFAVDLRRPGVRVEPVTWVARGLSEVASGAVSFTDVPATPVGGPGWYLRRDGFAWGGMGVAAVWHGGAVGVARTLRSAATRRPPDQIARHHLGAVDVALAGARSVLSQAATAVDSGRAAGPAGEMLALRVRGVVAQAVETVLTHADHGLGPGPLTQDEEHARRVADLRVYVRQHHAERDDAALGRRLLDSEDTW